jgi:hypothetical protein
MGKRKIRAVDVLYENCDDCGDTQKCVGNYGWKEPTVCVFFHSIKQTLHLSMHPPLILPKLLL